MTPQQTSEGARLHTWWRRLRAWASMLGAATALMVGSAHAAYPEKPIRLIVPAAAGGATDIVGRLIAQHLTQRMGQAVVVENLAGAAGTVGTRAVARAHPDGYTLLVGAINHAINATLIESLPYDSSNDFTFISQVVSLPNVLVINNAIPATTVGEFVTYLKANPGKLAFASSGNGTSQHLSGELFKQMTQTDFQTVPYKGAGPAKNDLLGGHVALMFDNLPSAIPLIRAGQIRALGLTSSVRNAAVPDIPTIAESGVPGFDVTSWMGLMGPKGLPPAIVERLHNELATVFALPDVQAQLTTLGAQSVVTDPATFKAYVASETVRWARLIDDAHIQKITGG